MQRQFQTVSNEVKGIAYLHVIKRSNLTVSPYTVVFPEGTTECALGEVEFFTTPQGDEFYSTMGECLRLNHYTVDDYK